jgi:HAD superfamily hydrolase (TIGR01509 family)
MHLEAIECVNRLSRAAEHEMPAHDCAATLRAAFAGWRLIGQDFGRSLVWMIHSSTIDLVIFDNDGVLVDSEPLAIQVVIDLAARCGYELTFEDCMERFLGLPIEKTRLGIETAMGRTLPADFEDRYHEELFARFTRDLHPVAGVVEVLDELDRSGVPYCVASSGTHERIEVALRTVGLLARFPDDRIFSAADVEHGKPAPDLFLLAATTTGASSDRCLVVEDSPAGVAAARAAGMCVVGYAGLTPVERLGDADAVVTAMSELLGVLGA